MPDANLIIRAATEADQPGWIDLRHHLWPDCPPERHRLETEQLLAGSGVVAVAYMENVLVGFAEVSVRADHVEGTSITPVPYLEGWYVSDTLRGKGVGRALINFVEDWSRQRGYTELASDAEIDNKQSIRLHGMLGFYEVGRTVHFVKPLGEGTP